MKPVAVAGVLRLALPRHGAELARAADAPPVAAQRDGAWGHFTRRQALALLFLREHVPAFRGLERGPWACLQALAAHWQKGRTDAYPGQDRLAMLSGYDARSIRDFTKQLEAYGVVSVVRVKLPDGTARLHYQPGPALLAAVDQFDVQFSDERRKPWEATTSGQAEVRAIRAKRPQAPAPPAIASGRGAEATSGELSDPRDQKNSSFCLALVPEGFASNQEPGPQVSELDVDVAREVLGTLRERRFGHRVRWFDPKIVAMVAACASVIDGDRETKRRALLDAMEHAFSVSRGTPTPSFVWGNIDHFLEHEAGGRNARLEGARARLRQERAAEGERARARERSRYAREACSPPPEVLQIIGELGCRKRPGQGADGRRFFEEQRGL